MKAVEVTGPAELALRQFGGDVPLPANPSKLKVALVTTFPQDPKRPRGGVEAVSVNLARALARLPSLQVHVITLDRDCSSGTVSKWEGATMHRLPATGGPLLLNAVGGYRRLVQQYVSQLNPDVVHAHDTYGIMVKGLNVPRVFTVHGFIHEDTLYAGGRFAWLRSKLWKRIEISAWADQPHIISISPYVRERLRGIAKGVVHDIENPIAAECFAVRRDEQPGTIFCAAAVCERKNTLGLVKAFAFLSRENSEARLRWAGPVVDAGYEKSVRQSIEEHGLTGKVTLLGPVGSEQIRAELAQAAVFALVSFEEGAPMGVAEAMAAGVPVAASNRCGMPYMVRDGETGFLVNPNDPADMAGRIGEILRDKTLRASMGRRSAEVALDLFHPDQVAKRTVAVYRRVANQCNPRKL
jgi:glycosyltransferase involved in cell wall biosynthesis